MSRKKHDFQPIEDWRKDQEHELEQRFPQQQFTPKVPHLKTENHKHYVQSIESKIITICYGPSGTGKTWLACSIAARMLLAGEIDRLVMVRPTVTCGGSLGFLPGTLEEKIDPYLSPLVDSLSDFISASKISELRYEKKIIGSPLELMRGKTFARSFVILDEAQNATKDQTLMFLTRLGEGSKFVVNGDVRQDDLKSFETSGLSHAADTLEDPQIAVVEMDRRDIMRHGLVRVILDQWDYVPPLPSYGRTPR